MENTKETLINNAFMFIYARQNKPTAEKIVNIEKALNDGAYINFPDANDYKNTILHIATQQEEKDLVAFLLSRGALLLNNADNKTPLQIAKEKNTEVSKEILNILTNNGKHLPRIDVSSPRNLRELNKKRSISLNSGPASPTGAMYQKRDGTSGVSGQLYETKLLSLIFHRALHDKVIEECYLASNIANIGNVDDVCFRFKMKEDGKTKDIMCFIQAKHRKDPNNHRITVESLKGDSGQFSLVKYFNSFLKIKQKFVDKNSKTCDPMFEGEFKDVDCYFILYTPLKKHFDRVLTGNEPISHKLHDFINTGEQKEDVFQLNYDISEIDSLTKFMQQKRIKDLGKHFLKSIMSGKTKFIMSNDLIKIYHPALAQNVIELSGRDPNFFEGKFRKDFFDSDDDLLITLKETLYDLIVIKQTKKTGLTKEEVKEKVKAIVNNPCAETISTLIGQVILFDHKRNRLRLNKTKISLKQYKTDDIREINEYLQKCQVTQAIVSDAINIIGKEKLESLTFKLPHNFGNSDFPSELKQVKKDKKKDRRVFLAEKFHELISEAKLRLEEQRKNKNEEKILHPVEICICDKNVGPKLILEPSHLYETTGIGGTVGNLLKFDKETQCFTFNTNEESLGENSKYILREIIKLTQDDLAHYKINVKMNNFPQTSFEANETDKKLAKDFLSKLWFYTNQANEETVESILKKEIDQHYNVDKSQNQILFRVHSDAIFLRFHDEIQKWWKSQAQARYLTKTDTIFDEAKKDIINSPVLTVHNFMILRDLKNLDIEFDADAINSMDIQKKIETNKILNIISAAVILSATKIMQLVRLQNNYTFVYLDYYVRKLPENDKNKLMNELSEMKAVVLVIICETSLDEQHQNTINEIIKMYQERIIVITDKPLPEKTYQNNECIVFHDENLNLNNLHPDSQTKVLKEFNVCYQGKTVALNAIIDDDSKTLVHAKFLWPLLNKVKIEIGQTLDSFEYDEIKDYYVNRTLLRNSEEYEVNTLNDIDDAIVLINSKPCMGKTILLTHLSLETKKTDPKPWIVRINMSAYNNDFVEGKLNATHVMRFLCKAALKTTDTIKQLNFTESTDQTVELNKENLEDISFELEWFIHFYNQGKIILLFDGFDEIHPHFTKEGIELFLALKRANKRMWITSSCYIVHILERELGDSYKLEWLEPNEQESFLSRFWKTNLKLEKLNHQQINNIIMFYNYIMKFFKSESIASIQERPAISLLSVPFQIIYLWAVEYFKNEMNSLSPSFFRETIKKKLNFYTSIDRFLRKGEEVSLELAGTPLHMYIAVNYFILQTRDEFKLHLNNDLLINRSNVYLNAITSYKIFLKNNIKHICENENRTFEKEQDKVRDDILESHRKIVLYAICKECDLPKFLTETEISEVESTFKKLESGEIKSQFIDCIVDGKPQLYNILFAEYFIVECASDILTWLFRGNSTHLTLESVWDLIVNIILTVCPPGVRNAFHYKLKYDPELAEAASNEKTNKIIFELLLKQKAKSEIAGRDAGTCLNVSDGLVNIVIHLLLNLLFKIARWYVTRDNVDTFLTNLKYGTFILRLAKPTWIQQAPNVMRFIDSLDGESLIEMINSTVMEGVSQKFLSTQIGQKLQEAIKKEICGPIQQFMERLVACSQDNKNLTTLLQFLSYHLPTIVNSLFGQHTEEDDQQGSTSLNSSLESFEKQQE